MNPEPLQESPPDAEAGVITVHGEVIAEQEPEEESGHVLDYENFPVEEDEPPAGEDNSPKILTPKMKGALRILACGYSPLFAAQQTGYSIYRVRELQNCESGKIYMSQIATGLDNDFQLLYGQVISSLRDGLNYPDPKIRLASASLWGKMSGKFKQTIVTESAEDVVKRLIEAEATDG